jgi:uncharacterized protein (TIGR02145 family)
MKTRTKILIYFLLLMGVLFLIANSCKKENDSIPLETGTVTDIEGNVYKTVKIGKQWWMAENLKATRYRNGDSIPNVIDSALWVNLSSGAYCNYDNSPGNSEIYGRLYNWYSVDDRRNLAPSGWHVSTDAEWFTLTTYLGGVNAAKVKLHERGSTHWQFYNPKATNESGFTALPAGERFPYSNFSNLGYDATFWTNREYDSLCAWYWGLGFGYEDVYRINIQKSCGFSVRCIMDN